MKPHVRRKTPKQACQEIVAIIEAVENRCMAADGPVTHTLEEMDEGEITQIYKLALWATRPPRRKR